MIARAVCTTGKSEMLPIAQAARALGTSETSLRRWIKAGALYAAYRQWCEGNGHQPVSNTRFGLALGERGFQREKLGTIRWLGVGLLESGRLDSLDRSSSSTDSRAHNPGNAELRSRPSHRPDWEVF